MGILITSILSHTNVKPKRVRISEDDRQNLPPVIGFGFDNDRRTNYGTSLSRSGLVRRNAISRRWRSRAMPHNPSPADEGTPVDEIGIGRVIPMESPEINNTRRSNRPTIDSPPPPTMVAPPSAIYRNGTERNRGSIDGGELEGLSLAELERRADELRRTLSDRHHINIDFSDLSRSENEPRDYTIDEEGEEEEDTRGEVPLNERNMDQRAQSLMYEIRRRMRTSRRRSIGRPFGDAGNQRRSNIDEYDALIQDNEPNQNWRRRAFRIHRNNIGDRSSDNEGDNGVNHERRRREQNRHAFVTSLGDEDEDADNNDNNEEEAPLAFGIF